MRRITSFLLILILFMTALLSGILISCGSDTPAENPDNTNAAASQDDEQSAKPEEGADIRIEPGLPDSDFEGYEFTFLSHLYDGDDWVNPTPLELISEEESGEPINDAVYRRNMTIKEKYNINLRIIAESNEASALRNAVSAGDSIYDAVVMFNNNIPGIITNDLLTNVEHLPYIDLDKPWWDPAVNSMSIDNKNYLLGGDLLILDNEATNALLFNKDLMADLGLELPYSLVTEHKWTMDTFNQYIIGASSDIDGDGQMSPYNDRWGFVAFNDTLHALLVAGGGALAVKDDEDMPFIDFTSPRNLSVIDKIMDIMYNKEDTLNVQTDTPSADWSPVYFGSFEENRSLFMWVRMRVVEKYRGMEASFGILPLPKFDEAQANHYSVVNPYTGALIGIPKSAADLDRVSIILEALAAESRYTLQPAYYDVVLMRKYTRDEESSEMLDIIFSSRVYDIGSLYNFGNVFIDFIGLCGRQDRNVVSYHERRAGAMQGAIDRTVEVFRSMD